MSPSGATSQGTCAHCGLPLPRSWWGKGDSCAGRRPGPGLLLLRLPVCRVDPARTERAEFGEGVRLTRLGVAIFFTMNVLAFTMALWTTDVYAVEDRPRRA